MPDDRVFVLIGNADYEKRRKEEGYAGFIDLPAAFDDLENLRSHQFLVSAFHQSSKLDL